MRHMVDHILAVEALHGVAKLLQHCSQKVSYVFVCHLRVQRLVSSSEWVEGSILRDQWSEDPGWWVGSAVLSM